LLGTLTALTNVEDFLKKGFGEYKDNDVGENIDILENMSGCSGLFFINMSYH